MPGSSHNRGNDGKLFRTGNPKLNAILHSYGTDELAFMLDAKDYREGAETLLKAAKSGETHPSSLALPLLYLYRHYLELQLKRLICVGMKFLTLLGANQPPISYQHHRLMELHDSVGSLLKEACEYVRSFGQIEPRLEPPPSPSADVLRALKGWNKWDPDSQTFRFPTKKSGSPSRRPGILNLDEFEKAMIRPLVEYLDELDGWFHFYTSFVYH